ncbi:hypothetical protein TorRG33x02_068700, partial [Trema orientale]
LLASFFLMLTTGRARYLKGMLRSFLRTALCMESADDDDDVVSCSVMVMMMMIR